MVDEVLKIIERCHIFGITQTHPLPSNGKQLAGYKDFHSCRKNGTRKNYTCNSGGLSVYIRDVIHGETPDYIWVEMNTNFFHLEENIYIGVVYIVPVNSSINDRDRTAYGSLEKDISKFSVTGNVMLLEDFNSRVSTLSDFIINGDDKHSRYIHVFY